MKVIKAGDRFHAPCGGTFQVMSVLPNGEARCTYLGERGGLCRDRGAVNFTTNALQLFKPVTAPLNTWYGQ